MAAVAGSKHRLLPSVLIITAVLVQSNAVNSLDEQLQCEADEHLQLKEGSGRSNGLVVYPDRSGNLTRYCFMSNLYYSKWQSVVNLVKVMCRQARQKSEEVSIIARDFSKQSASLNATYQNEAHLYRVVCTGTEASLSGCQPEGYGLKNSHNIVNSMHISECWYGIACEPDSAMRATFHHSGLLARLVPGSRLFNETRFGDMVGITVFGLNGYVCAGYTPNSVEKIAKVACRENGYRMSLAFNLDVDYVANGSCFMHWTECSGRERKLSECKQSGFWGPLTNEFYIPEHMFFPELFVFAQCATGMTDFNVWLHSNDTIGPSRASSAVYVTYQDISMPVIGFFTAETCRAVCAHVTQSRNFSSVCVTEEMPESNLYQDTGYGYFATIDCPLGNESLIDCNFGIHVIDGQSYRYDLKIYAACVPTRQKQTVPFEIALAIMSASTSGYDDHQGSYTKVEKELNQVAVLLLHNIESFLSIYLLVNSPSTKAHHAALVVCSQHSRNRQSHVQPIWALETLQQYNHFQAFIACDDSAVSIDQCSLLATNEVAQHALRIACVPDFTFRLNLTLGFGDSDGVIQIIIKEGMSAYVSMEGWSDRAAAVACRQLGVKTTRPRAISKFVKPVSRKFWMVRIASCKGSEAVLNDCEFTYALQKLDARENYIYVGGVFCDGATNLSVRLINTTNYENPVAPVIEHGNRRTYTCWYFDNSRTVEPSLMASHALCRAGGRMDVEMAWDAGPTHGVVQDIHTDMAVIGLSCGSKKSPIEECSYEKRVLVAECTTWQDASEVVGQIKCVNRNYGSKLRLIGGASAYEGHVELLHNGEWTAVCDDQFTDFSSSLVCRELFGDNSVGQAVHGSQFSVRNEKFFSESHHCIEGVHQRFKQCYHGENGLGGDCNACEQAGVKCSHVPYIGSPTVSLTFVHGKLTLRCFAEAIPPAKYQWFVNGSLGRDQDSSVTLDCFERDHSAAIVSYVCYVYNEAGEDSVEVLAGSHVGCVAGSAEQHSTPQASNGSDFIIAMLFLAIALMLVVASAVYALIVRRRLAQQRSSLPGIPSIGFENPVFVSEDAPSSSKL